MSSRRSGIIARMRIEYLTFGEVGWPKIVVIAEKGDDILEVESGARRMAKQLRGRVLNIPVCVKREFDCGWLEEISE